jgi:hypothetical protein
MSKAIESDCSFHDIYAKWWNEDAAYDDEVSGRYSCQAPYANLPGARYMAGRKALCEKSPTASQKQPDEPNEADLQTSGILVPRPSLLPLTRAEEDASTESWELVIRPKIQPSLD